MDRTGFLAVLERLQAGWNGGDAAAVAACFAERVDYADPLRYRFEDRASLLPFFAPPPGGHSVTWHRAVFDPETRVGAVEYTYVGHHRYHGAAFVTLDDDGLITGWREWQHVADDADWEAFVAGPHAAADAESDRAAYSRTPERPDPFWASIETWTDEDDR